MAGSSTTPLNDNPVEPNAPRPIGQDNPDKAKSADKKSDKGPANIDTTKISQDGGTPGM